MSGALSKVVVNPVAELAGGGLDKGRSPGLSRRASAPSDCFHCGEPCPDTAFNSGDKAFCCQGCRVVHDLLTENGLDHFYSLTDSPGIRIRPSARPERWLYLDEPALQQRLLDFTDERLSRMTFHIPAIHCVACVWLLENLFRLNPAIGSSHVNFPKRELAISFSPDKLKLSELVALLASIGYEPALTLGGLEKRKANPSHRRRWLQLGIAGFAFGNIMLFSLPRYLGLDSLSGPLFATIFGYLSLALAAPVVIYSASDYWKAAWLAVRRRVLILDIPIALGLAALYLQSGYEVIGGHGEGYLDSLTALIFFLLCGRAFQQKTYDRLAFDLDYKSFFPLSVTRVARAPRSADFQSAVSPIFNRQGVSPIDRVIGAQNVSNVSRSAECNSAIQQIENLRYKGGDDDDAEEHASLSELQVGDRIRLRNGELIPADGILVRGEALIDYSFVTGESESMAKRVGDYLYAGGQQVGAAIEVEIVKPVSQSYLTSLWNHEAFRKERDQDLNTLTNRYSRRFTRIVMAIAFGSALFWVAMGDLPRGIKAFTSVLIVACPCALALAAPFTLGTAQRILARINAFVRNALVLERMAQVNTIVFDKTGTLTAAGGSTVRFHGTGGSRPRGDVASACRVSRGEEAQAVSEKANPGLPINEPMLCPALLAGSADEERWIYSVARQSTHPLSQRISDALRRDYAAEPVTAFRETAGAGVEAEAGGHTILLGSAVWLEAHGINRFSSAIHGVETDADTASPGSTVHVAIDGNYRGAFVFANAVRPETGRLLRDLSTHYELALLSGDNERERERFQALFGPKAPLQFNRSPLEKLSYTDQLQRAGRTVMMVGDGLNDAGALKQADVGVAVVEKVGAFSPSSDVILEAALVPQLGRILRFARAVTRIVYAGFVISAFYNVVGVSIAACGVLSPLVCAILMPLSSASVVFFACGATSLAARRLGLRPKPVESTPQPSTRDVPSLRPEPAV